MVTIISLDKYGKTSPTWQAQFIFMHESPEDIVTLAKLFGSVIKSVRICATGDRVDAFMTPQRAMTENEIMMATAMIRLAGKSSDEISVETHFYPTNAEYQPSSL